MSRVPLRNKKAQIAKLAGFVVVPACSAIVPLLAIPVITSKFGGNAWVAVALGISIGSAGAVLVELGWALNGSIRVARAHEAARHSILSMALATKISAFFVLAVPVIAATLVLEDKFPFLAMFVGLANLGTGLTSSWYFIGLGSPWSIVVSDVMPRVLATAMSCVAILIWNAPAVLYGQLLLLASVASVFVSIRVAQMPPGLVLGHTLPRFMLSLRNQRSALIARGVSSLYIALPVTLV